MSLRKIRRIVVRKILFDQIANAIFRIKRMQSRGHDHFRWNKWNSYFFVITTAFFLFTICIVKKIDVFFFFKQNSFRKKKKMCSKKKLYFENFHSLYKYDKNRLISSFLYKKKKKKKNRCVRMKCCRNFNFFFFVSR